MNLILVPAIKAVVGSGDWVDRGAHHGPGRRRRIRVTDISLVPRLVDALCIQVLVFHFSFVVFGGGLWVPFRWIELGLHGLRKHLARLLVLHTAVRKRILHARNIVFLVQIHQIRIIYHDLQRCPTHLDVIIYVLL